MCIVITQNSSYWYLLFFVADIHTAILAPETIDGEHSIICTPKSGNWTGGDSVTMIFRELDLNEGVFLCLFPLNIFSILFEGLSIYFNFVGSSKKSIYYKSINKNTICFKTPRHPSESNGHQQSVEISAVQKQKLIGKFSFVYLARECITCIWTQFQCIV
jgi:hypothetical protein